MNSLSVLVMQILPASMNFVFVYLWMFTVSSAVGEQTCIKRSQWGWSLENASYHQMETKDYPTCLVNCITDKRCRSLTYDLLGKKCKLSGETRLTRPLQYIGNISNSIYMEMVPTADRMLPIASAIPFTSQPPATPQTTTEPPTTPQTTTQPQTTPLTTSKPPTTTEPPTTPQTTSEPPTTPQTTTEPPTTPQTTSQPPTTPLTTSQPPTTSQTTTQPPTTPQTTTQPTTTPLTTTEPPTTPQTIAQPPTTPQTTTEPPTTPQTTTQPPTTPQTTTQPPTTPQTTTQPTTIFDSSTYCIGKSNGDYLHPTDCSKYIICSNDYTHEMLCGSTINIVCLAGC